MSQALLAQDFVSPARWQGERVVVDGQYNEWETPFKFYNRSAGLTYSISNDETHLYLCFVSLSPLKIVKMLHAGWSMQISSKERKKKLNASIDFSTMTIDLEPKHDYTAENEKKEPTFKNWLDDYRLENCHYYVQKFKKSHDKHFEMSDTSSSIRIVLQYNEVEAVYEMAIPLDELFAAKTRTLDEVLKLKIDINGLEMPQDEDSKLSVGPVKKMTPIISGSRGNFNDPIVGIEDREPKEPSNEDGLYRKAHFVTDFKLVARPKEP